MPRFVWIIVLLWCAALAQVQPVEPLATKAEKECCGCDGACGMPACAMLPAPAQPAADLEPALTVARPLTKATALRAPADLAKFFSLALPAVRETADPPAPPVAAPPASGPLFQRHCSLLI
jgi:hypothetical protein